MNRTARSNILRALRRTLAINNLAATRIVDRLFVSDVPMHDVVVAVETFDERNASGWCVLAVDDVRVGAASLGKGELARWLASDEGRARIEAKAAEERAEEALKQRGKILWITHSDRWPGTAEVVLDDRRAFPLIPLSDESAEDVRREHGDLTPGTSVVMRIVPAAEIVDEFARTLDQTQPCVDWIMRDREAA